ncbi:hypothetical protein AB0C89_17575 [Streptomyces sp. NPDC048491]|uniref:hypothetical protein n=1 Tax=Streptomyces sp. NPDC048491 TaxID=3157207 RepID=UPI003420A6FD
MVLAVVTDREGRWWQAMECCSRCAAATPGARTVATATSAPQAVNPESGGARVAAASAGVPQFSDRSLGSNKVPEPAARSGARRARPPRDGRIAGHVVPHSLRPIELRDELTELGGLFRAYQQRTEPDLDLLADLQRRKSAAFSGWAEATGDTFLRREAQRAGQAADTARLQHRQRSCRTAEGEPAVMRVVPGSGMWEHARSVLAHCADHAPLPGPEARLVSELLTLRTARHLAEQLTGCGWPSLPGSVDDLLDSRPENPTPITIPSFLPGGAHADAFGFGRPARAKLSGWAQKAVADRHLRKTKATAGARLLALTLATRTRGDGHLGGDGQGLPLPQVASLSATDAEEMPHLLDELTRADWLTDSTLTRSRLTGRFTDRVLPLTCPLLTPVATAPRPRLRRGGIGVAGRAGSPA